MSSDLVTIDISNGIADVRLNREEKYNALSQDMFDAIIEAGQSLATADDVSAVVLSGNGRGFCAGLDMSSFASMSDGSRKSQSGTDALLAKSDSPENRAQRPALVWKRLPMPVIDLQEILKDVTGMQGVSLAPMAGAQGEFAGVAMIRAYHEARGDDARTEIIVPTAAHGTNPATAVMCGYKVTEVPINSEGDVDLEALKEKVGPQTAGLMMTNPSTCGVFERQIEAIATTVHDAGGLLYYDGANLNAILGKVKPGDMGFDVLHMNLHKTFATPHGGGGPGAGPVGVGERLLPHLPVPVVAKEDDGYRWMGMDDRSIFTWKLPATLRSTRTTWLRMWASCWAKR